MAETITQITQPPEFIETEAKLYLDQLKNAIGGLKGADLSKILGPYSPLTFFTGNIGRSFWFYIKKNFHVDQK